MSSLASWPGASPILGTSCSAGQWQKVILYVQAELFRFLVLGITPSLLCVCSAWTVHCSAPRV